MKKPFEPGDHVKCQYGNTDNKLYSEFLNTHPMIKSMTEVSGENMYKIVFEGMPDREFNSNDFVRTVAPLHTSWTDKALKRSDLKRGAASNYILGVIDFRSKALDALDKFTMMTLDEPVLVDDKVYVCLDDVVRLVEGLYAETVTVCIDDDMRKVEETIDIIRDEDALGSQDLAMKHLYSVLYDALMDSDYELVDLYIDRFMFKHFSVMLQVALARVTKPHQDKLKNREALITALTENLQKECPTKEEADNVLSHVK